MEQYVSQALFVHTDDTAQVLEHLQKHASQPTVTPVLIDALMADPQHVLAGVSHVVACGSPQVIKDVLKLADNYGFSVGVVPTATQKNVIKFYLIPRDIDAAVDLALRSDPTPLDLVLCNGHVVLFKAVVGDMPLLDTPADVGVFGILRTAAKRIFRIKLIKYRFVTAEEQVIDTAASGCMILHHNKGSMAARLIAGDSSISDGFVSAVISAPISIIMYLGFLMRLTGPTVRYGQLPNAIGYLKSPVIEIEPETELDVFIDGENKTVTPVRCEVKPAAVKVNVSQDLLKKTESSETVSERIDVDNLPMGKELKKARRKDRIPFFSYASEERFRDLFAALREDAEINLIYLVLMVLSTMLAAAGLYLDSASVIIGAMLLAPLMAPIVALAMGLLRADNSMTRKSLQKILVGIAIALLASATIALLFPHKPVTGEMQARLNPTLLDMAVAIISGIAAAYSKSFREIIQSLAGVAIAVALVPPLAVSGTGLGRGDFNFFFQAFLLFSTNLVGIIIAAAVTFRLLGYSPAIRSKRSLGLVMLLLALIAVPLYASYSRIVEERIIEERWEKERFLVNGKYIIVEKANVLWQEEKKILVMEIHLRDVLTREDMNAFRKKINANFSSDIVVRAKTVYIP